MFNSSCTFLLSDSKDEVGLQGPCLYSLNPQGQPSEPTEETHDLHIPVMLKEALDYLKLKPGQVIVDATAGTGGHSLKILEKISPEGKLIAIDRDEDSLKIADKNLKAYKSSYQLVHGNFMDIDSILHSRGVDKVDGILFDLGISSFQLDDAERGFSFQKNGPLDMRMDRTSYISAYDLINNLHEDEISELLWTFGQERWHRRIARLIVRQREISPITTTSQLSDVVLKALPYSYRRSYHRIHPATRTFQAIRIAVNRELETLEKALDKAVNLLNEGARICVISFHSLEDRIVKFKFREEAARGALEIITPKPLSPDDSESQVNPSSRSAKMRVAERL